MSKRIYLFGQADAFRSVKQLLSTQDGFVIVGESDDEINALGDIGKLKADIALYYVDGSSYVYRVAQQVYMLDPDCINIALIPSDILQSEIESLLHNGIRYYVDTENINSGFFDVIKNALTIEGNRLESLKDSSSLVSDCQVLTYYGAKDGLGRTTFLVNMGVFLSKKKKKVAILDFDLQFGDVNVLTGIETHETIADLLQEQQNPTIETIRQYISIHQSGLNILCAPRNPEYAEKIDGSQLEKIISSLRTYYDYILIDTSTRFDDNLVTCCELSSKILIFSRSDIAVLRQTKKAISMLNVLGFKDKLLLCLYGYDRHSKIKEADISRVLGLNIWQKIPLDTKNTVESINQGIPLVELYPKSSVCQACESAVDMFNKDKENSRKKKSRFGKTK